MPGVLARGSRLRRVYLRGGDNNGDTRAGSDGDRTAEDGAAAAVAMMAEGSAAAAAVTVNLDVTWFRLWL